MTDEIREKVARIVYAAIMRPGWPTYDDNLKHGGSTYFHEAKRSADAILALSPPVDGGRGDDDDGRLLRFMYELHSHLPEDQRPMSWSDFSDEQAARIRRAFAIALAPPPTPGLPFDYDLVPTADGKISDDAQAQANTDAAEAFLERRDGR